jgi:hypothetical protein
MIHRGEPQIRFSLIGILGVAAALLAGACGTSKSPTDGGHKDAAHDQTSDVPAQAGNGGAGAGGASGAGGAGATGGAGGGAGAAGAGGSAGVDAGSDATGAAGNAVGNSDGAVDAGTDATGAAGDAGDAMAETGGTTDAADGAAPDIAGDETAPDAAAEAGSDADDAGDAGDDLPPIHGPLLAHWPLDEGTGTTTADTSGNGDPGTLSNGPVWSTSSFPGHTFADPGSLTFDGVDDFVSLGVRALPRNDAPKTESLWYSQAVAGTARQNLLALTDFIHTGHGTQIGLEAGKPSVWFMNEVAGIITAATAPAAGWHHLAYTFDGTVHRLYLDGTLVGMVTRAPDAVPVSTAFLGAFDVTGLEVFNGTMDDVRIYDSALGQAAITTLSTGGEP